MNTTRREFIALSLASGVVPSAWAEETPIFTAGMMTDTHVSPDPRSLKRIREAYALFKEHRVDMIANVGDIADHFYPEAYRQYRAIREAAYPDRASAPKEIYCYDNHDWYEFPEPDDKEHSKCYAKIRETLGINHEPYDKFVFAGFTFLVFPLFHDDRYERMIKEACEANPGKPVFVFDHVPASDTIYGSNIGGSDVTRKVLEKYPNVVHFSGHIHGSLRNEEQIWQGAFTEINLGSLTYYGDVYPGNLEEYGQGHAVLIMRLFANRAEFRRYSLVDGTEISPDRVWTLSWDGGVMDKRFAPAERAKALATPEYAAGVALEWSFRGGLVDIALPEAKSARDLHQHRLTIERKENGGWRLVSVNHTRGDHWLERGMPRKRTMVLDRLLFREGGEYRLTLTPLGFWGLEGKALVKTAHFEKYAPTPLWSGMPEGFVKGEWRKCKSTQPTVATFLPEEDRKWAKVLMTVSVKDAPGALLQFKNGVHWPTPFAQVPNGADRLTFVVPFPRINYSELPWAVIGGTRGASVKFDEYTFYPCPDSEGDEWAHGVVRSFKAGDGVH